jgi:excisionase family DNA binding protein
MVTQALFSTKDVASHLGVHPNTVRKWVKEGKIPLLSVNGQYRFEKRAIDKWKDERSFYPKKLDKLSTGLDFHIHEYMMDLKGDSGMGKSPKPLKLSYGSIYTEKSKSGEIKYRLSYYDCNNKRRMPYARNANTLDEAVLELKSRIHQEFLKKVGVKEKKKIGFRDFADIYHDEYMSVNRRNFKSDVIRLNRMKTFFRDTELREVSLSRVQKFKLDRKQAGNSGRTVNRYLALLKSMFNVAIENEYLEKNLVTKIKFESELENERHRVLTYEEEIRLFAEANKQLKPVLVVALNTGMRLGEILNLMWNDVDLEEREIRLKKTKGRRSRVIPINSTLFDLLTKLKEDQGSSDFVFPFKSIRTAFENACRRAKIKNFTFHDLRRTFGTRLLERGVNIVTIQRLYGHSSVLVTQRYLHPRDDLKLEAVELLSGPVKEAVKEERLFGICSSDEADSLDDSVSTSFKVH